MSHGFFNFFISLEILSHFIDEKTDAWRGPKVSERWGQHSPLDCLLVGKSKKKKFHLVLISQKALLQLRSELRGLHFLLWQLKLKGIKLMTLEVIKNVNGINFTANFVVESMCCWHWRGVLYSPRTLSMKQAGVSIRRSGDGGWGVIGLCVVWHRQLQGRISSWNLFEHCFRLN